MSIGRAGEREVLGRTWKSAEQGAIQVVLVAGEPGIGKTRLATEIALQAHHQCGLVLLGTCDEDLAVPYQPFVEALRHLDRGIEIMSADGSGRHVVAHDDDGGLGEPVWSPDGTRIVFSVGRQQTKSHPAGQGWIGDVEVDSRRRRSLTPRYCHDSEPAWSPAGDRLAIANRGIATIDPDGSGRRQLTKGTHDYAPA